MAAQGTPKDTATETPKGARKVTFLLFLCMLVNFADKIVVGLAGGPIMDELKINPQQFGDLGSSFFYLFSISAIIVKNCSKPRAFSHAAAYLKRNRAITVATYLADLARQMTQVPKGAAYKTSVFPTFQLAMQQAEAEAPGARAVLTLAALTRLSRTSLDRQPAAMAPENRRRHSRSGISAVCAVS